MVLARCGAVVVLFRWTGAREEESWSPTVWADVKEMAC